MVDAEKNGIKEKGCQHLCQLERGRVEEIHLMSWSLLGRNGCMKVLITGWAPGGRSALRRRPGGGVDASN